MTESTSGSLAVLALARDCAGSLPRLFALLDQASRHFTVTCFVGENGSRDQTRAVLEAEAARGRGLTLVSTAMMSDEPARLARMAIGRELLRETWAAGPQSDFVCVVDVDNVLPAQPARVDLVGAAGLLRRDSALAGVSATSAPFYYDLLALRAPGLFNYDIGPMLQFGSRDPLFHYLAHSRMVYPAQRAVTAALPLTTISSFNGMCLYRGSDYSAASYRRLPLVEECEHVDFNRQLCADGRRILVSKELQLDMPDEHGPRGLAGFVTQRMAKLLRRR